MSLTFSLDFDFSSGYIKKQLENINTLCNAVINAKMIQEKIEDEEDDDDNTPTVVEKKKSNKKKSKSKIINTKINLLQLPDQDDEKELEISIRDIINEEKEDDSNEISVDGETMNNKKKEKKKTKEVVVTTPPVVRDTRFVPVGSVICECGVQYVSKNKCRHIKSKHHIEAMKFKNINC